MSENCFELCFYVNEKNLIDIPKNNDVQLLSVEQCEKGEFCVTKYANIQAIS